jgi:hypothetical protein
MRPAARKRLIPWWTVAASSSRARRSASHAPRRGRCSQRLAAGSTRGAVQTDAMMPDRVRIRFVKASQTLILLKKRIQSLFRAGSGVVVVQQLGPLRFIEHRHLAAAAPAIDQLHCDSSEQLLHVHPQRLREPAQHRQARVGGLPDRAAILFGRIRPLHCKALVRGARDYVPQHHLIKKMRKCLHLALAGGVRDHVSAHHPRALNDKQDLHSVSD